MARKNDSIVPNRPFRATFKLPVGIDTVEALVKAGNYDQEDYGYMSSYCRGAVSIPIGDFEVLLFCFKGLTVFEAREAILRTGAAPGTLGDLLVLGAVLPPEWRRRQGLRILAPGSCWDSGGILPIPKGKKSAEIPWEFPTISVDDEQLYGRGFKLAMMSFARKKRMPAGTLYLALPQPKG